MRGGVRRFTEGFGVEGIDTPDSGKTRRQVFSIE